MPEPREHQISYTQQGAADQLGVSLTFFKDHVLAELAIVRVGRRTLVPHAELERYVELHAEKVAAGRASR